MAATPRTYTVDGVTYRSLDAMPADVRSKVEAVLADRNGDGIPDIMQDFTFASVKPGGAMKLVTAPSTGTPGGDVSSSTSVVASVNAPATSTRRPAWLVPALVVAAIAAVIVLVVVLN